MNDIKTFKQKLYSKNLLVASDFGLRVFVGIVFAIAGFGKLFGTPGVAGFTGALDGMGFPLPALLAVLVGVIELAGGILLVLGIKTDLAAGLLAIIIFVAMLTAHAGDGWRVLQNLILLFLVLLRYTATTGFVRVNV